MQSKVKSLESKFEKGIFGEAENQPLLSTFYKLRSRRGLTLIEIVVVIAIVAIVATLIFGAFSRYRNSQAVDVNSRKVLTALEEARSNTLDSLEGSQYGVRFHSDKAEVFKGGTYSSANVVREYELDDPVVVEEISIGGGSDVIFERLSGKAVNSGFLRLGLPGSDSTDVRIIIEATGLSYVE